MTIDDAVETLALFIQPEHSTIELDEEEAIKLGIEALKFYRGVKETIDAYKGVLLPGETKE